MPYVYVNVPNDLSKVKTKVVFNLTKRQLICFGGGAAIGIPAYLLSKGAFGNCTALYQHHHHHPAHGSRVQTVGSAAGSGVMSIEAQVDELWGSSKDDDWKKQEVARIRYERGITELPEPDVGTGV